MDKVANRENILKFLNELPDVNQADRGRIMNTTFFQPPIIPDLKYSPHSSEYREFQLNFWKEISGIESYEPKITEKDNFFSIRNEQLFKVYPFSTGDSICVGSYFAGIGILLRALQLPPGSTIVEYGVGWGHTSLLMAQMGYRVIAVDIEQKFLDLLQIRANVMSLDISVHQGEFGDLPSDVPDVDAFVFYECFHHWLDHVSGLTKIYNRLKDGGRVVLAGEPLFDDNWHYPWGLRTDAQSLWAMSTHGWMELGFKRSYIFDLLKSNRFRLEHHNHAEFGCVGEVVVGVKSIES